MTDTPKPRSNAISPVVTMGAGGPDLTAPEQVERFSYSGMGIDDDGLWVLHSDYAALAAKLEATEAENEDCLAKLESALDQRDTADARAEAAEAERDAALGVLQEMRDYGGKDWVVERAFAFLAARQKGGE